MRKKRETFQLKVPSETKNLEIIRSFIYRTAIKAGFDSECASRIELSVDEACSNVIKHAYQMKTDNFIEINISIDKEKFVVTIIDQGKGFNPEKIELPDMMEYLAELRVGGLGIYLMKTLMDEVEYDIIPGKKNIVRMVKYFYALEE